MPQSFALACVESNSPSLSCDCLAHRFGNAADGPERVRCYGSDMTDAEWQVIRAVLPVPAWLEGRGGRPELSELLDEGSMHAGFLLTRRAAATGDLRELQRI